MVRQIHRWAGGLLGVVLVLVGLSGALLAQRHHWIVLDGQSTATPLRSADLIATIASRRDLDARFVILPNEDFAYARVMTTGEGGAYVTAAGEVAERWTSRWARPEEWLFDLHATLLLGASGETINGVLALVGIAFLVTGIILWWPSRRLFALRPWPRRLDRARIVHHHRDLGLLSAPLLLVALLTGAILTLRPLSAGLMLLFSSPAELSRPDAPPPIVSAGLAQDFDWGAAFDAAQNQFPKAIVRVVGIPRAADQPVMIRMRQPGEWVERGQSMVWLHPQTGEILHVRDGHQVPQGRKAYFSMLPMHTGDVGGELWRAAITLAGVVLTALGGFTTWTFWRSRLGPARPRRRPREPASALQP
jgi:uncharacterized iron-regulated membrane protein